MHASKPLRLDRCGRRCDWPGPDAGGDEGARQRRRAQQSGLMLPARGDVRTPLQALLHTRCENAFSLMARAHCAPVLYIVLRPMPVLH
jgi:hypothetical protein